MGLLDWLFKAKRPAAVALSLDPLMGVVLRTASSAVAAPIPAPLLRARLADVCREAGKRPLSAEAWGRIAATLDDEATRRCWLVAELLREEEVMEHTASLWPGEDAAPLVEQVVLGVVEATSPVTMQLLFDSPLRVEEFARHFVARLGASVEDEEVADSQARLERLDYRSLLAQAERAKESAEERLEYLRALQADLEARRAPRGKW